MINATDFKTEDYLCATNGISISDDLYISSNDEQYIDSIKKIDSSKNDAEDIQKINIAKNEYNLIVLAGEKTSSGHSLDFKNATLSNQNLNLYFEEISPGDQSKVLTVMTYPYCLLKINKIENYQINVIFE